jgi:hypothetical protein
MTLCLLDWRQTECKVVRHSSISTVGPLLVANLNGHIYSRKEESTWDSIHKSSLTVFDKCFFAVMDRYRYDTIVPTKVSFELLLIHFEFIL